MSSERHDPNVDATPRTVDEDPRQAADAKSPEPRDTPIARHSITADLFLPEAPRSVRDAAPARRVRSVLLVADEVRTLAPLAARLEARGCTCCIADLGTARARLDERPFHAVVLEVPSNEARSDGGAARVAALGSVDCAVVLSSPAPIERERRPNTKVVAALLKPFFADALVRILCENGVEASTDRGTIDPPPIATAPLLPALSGDVLPATLVFDANHSTPVRIIELTATGALSVVSATLLPAGSEVVVELVARDGRRMDIDGVVSEKSATEMRIASKLGEDERRFLASFLADSSNAVPNQRKLVLHPVRTSEPPVAAAPASRGDEEPIEDLWQRASKNLDDDALQQTFISRCIADHNLGFAVERYRELGSRDPNDARAKRYLAQVGTILSFWAMPRAGAGSDRSRIPNSIKLLGALVLLVVVLAVIGLMAR